jgi:hypothetical protein
VADRADKESETLAELRLTIQAGIEKSKRLVARSRELIGAAAPDDPEPHVEREPPAIAIAPAPPRAE